MGLETGLFPAIRPLRITFLFPVYRPHPVPSPASRSIARISALFVLRVTIAAVEDLLSVTIYDLCCSKALLQLTIFELGDDRMSLREFYRHISICRNVYCKLCRCSTSLKLWLKYLLKWKFPATNNNNNRPPACMSKPFPWRETGNLFGVALAQTIHVWRKITHKGSAVRLSEQLSPLLRTPNFEPKVAMSSEIRESHWGNTAQIMRTFSF